MEVFLGFTHLKIQTQRRPFSECVKKNAKTNFEDSHLDACHQSGETDCTTSSDYKQSASV